MTPSQAIDMLKKVLAYIELVHSPEIPKEVEVVYQQVMPDQVESIQIIHLAASIAAKESEC